MLELREAGLLPASSLRLIMMSRLALPSAQVAWKEASMPRLVEEGHSLPCAHKETCMWNADFTQQKDERAIFRKDSIKY